MQIDIHKEQRTTDNKLQIIYKTYDYVDHIAVTF